jgi:integrase
MSGTQNTGNENTEVAKPKTVSLLRFKTDRTKEVEGVWVDVGGGLRFKVARMGNPQYEQYLMKRGRFFGRGMRLIKGEKVRVVFLSDDAKKAVAAYLKKRGDFGEALFVGYSKARKTKDLSRLTPRSVERLVKNYAMKAGITRKVTPHVIRHSFATDLLSNGADLRSVQALLGHANIATTQVYTHVTDSHLRNVHKAFHGKRRR